MAAGICRVKKGGSAHHTFAACVITAWWWWPNTETLMRGPHGDEVCCWITVPLQTWQQKGKHRYARARVAGCLFNAHRDSPAHGQTALASSWLPLAIQSPVLWTRTGSWPRTLGSNYLTGSEYVRALVFFVWQCREAPKEWPWLMKNQRWVSPHCINIPVYFTRSVAQGFIEKTDIFTSSVHIVKVES